jgi:O-antigen ligase
MVDSSQSPTLTLRAAAYSLLLGLFALPFSIAITNTCIGIALLLSLFFRPDVITLGFHTCWSQYRAISIGILLYAFLTVFGAFWSSDTASSIHFIGKLIYWFIIPVVIGLSFYCPALLKKAFIALSSGLFLHLIVCTMQYFGLVTIPDTGAGGTSSNDPTGFLGHLNFGFIYAVWAGTLLIVSQQLTSKWKIIFCILAVYAIVSVFLTQGRGGYIIVLAVLALIAWKTCFKKHIGYFFISLIVTIGIGTIVISINHNAQQRVQYTLNGIESFVDGNYAISSPRLKIWKVTLDIYLEHPYLGIGTGDFESSFIKKIQDTDYESYHITTSYDNPHNEFLFGLVRWGPVGLAAFLFLIIMWVRTGLKKDWSVQPVQAYLLTSSGLAILINSFSDSSLSGYSSTIFAIIVLGFAMSKDSLGNHH